jgi:hypothetical protein
MRKESQEEEIHEKRIFTRRGYSQEEDIHKKRICKKR